MSGLLSVRGLNAFYGQAQALDHVHLEVGEGEVVGVVGANGAGKSTTLKAIMGLLPRTDGEMVFAQQSIIAWPAHRRARLGIGYVPEDRRIFTQLSVEENLRLGLNARRPGAPDEAALRRRVEQLFPPLHRLAHRPGGQLSGGEQQMLAVARSLMGAPRLLLLDEPTEGLAPVIVEQMVETIAAICKEGVGVLLCEQNAALIGPLMHRGYLIDEGHIVAEGGLRHLEAVAAERFDRAAHTSTTSPS